MADSIVPLSELEGPNLSWGEPLGRFELEIVKGGAYFHHRRQGFVQKIFMTTLELAEMASLVGMLSFDHPVEPPNGRIRIVG